MTTTPSSQPHTQLRSSRPTTTPAARPPRNPGSVGQNMPPFLSPHISTPLQSNHTAKTPSPNYFGFTPTEGAPYLAENENARRNWSPPSSAVRSTAAISPTVVPLDQNPEFDAFRRVSEGKAFNLGNLHDFKMAPPPAMKPKHNRAASKTGKESEKSTSPKAVPSNPARQHGDSLDPESAQLGRSPKRLLSADSTTFPDPPRRASPASFTPNDPTQDRRSSAGPDRHPRSQLPLDNSHGPHGFPKHRAETLPDIGGSEASMMVTSQHVVNLVDSAEEEILILDLRVSSQYARSHIRGALNLCIPTTLLKRPKFNAQKLAETFQDERQKLKFQGWRSSKYLVVYDGSSSQLKDAAICVNTIKKFQSEGYKGSLYILSGGFAEFSKRFSNLVEDGMDSASSNSSKLRTGDGPNIAPVIGGCPMPGTDKPANPFFGNIRQNMDLIGGVGQIPLKHPSTATKSDEEDFPAWLREAANENDQGKKVSNKFEQIERREKKRMEEALSGKVSFGTPVQKPEKAMQIAGIEKGNKNRYNNIWPYEHSRVKLQGVPSHGCDYFNANYIQASLSHKKYISTQAPIPATFSDFWNVVWQQDVRVIVMLTAEKEGAQVKAHNYWNENKYGPLHIEFLSEKRASLEPEKIHRHKYRPAAGRRTSTNQKVPLAILDSSEKSGDQPYVIVRKFTISHENFPFERMREITQLQYSSWPDFGAPAHPAHLLGLVEQCDAVVRSIQRTHTAEPDPPNPRPILVHCSAGCGRTGTFCTVDSVVDMLKRQRISRTQRHTSPMDLDPKASRQGDGGGFFESRSKSGNDGPEGNWVHRDDQDLIEKTVEDFRHQRISMVQSLRQYVLCYESVMEWLVEQEHPPVSA